MRVLITGGAGFVGANLGIAMKRHFADATVVAMDNLYRRGSELNLPRLRADGVRFHYGDIREPSAFPAGPFDFLIECAAEPSVLAGIESSPDQVVHTNLLGAYNCLEKARIWKSRFLLLSTSRVYPIQRLESHPWVEDATRFRWKDGETRGISSEGVREDVDMAGARTLYGYTKFAAELLVEEYRYVFGLRSVINRCGVITGPWQFGKVDQGVASLWVLAHWFGRPLSYIGYGGSGKQVRDFLHVTDLCDLIIEQVGAFESWDGWVGNVAGGLANAASLRELTAICRELTGRETDINLVLVDRPGDLRIFIGDCTRLFARTSWRPRRSVHHIFEDMAAWVREHSTALETLQS
ncbi:MAG TPA: NAD-dependent epimerase/dehydratase family protein [Terriglobia bacterium]|nr:NAD-dependent epimerase/dehydratase family protein [Terriglobia bacterium]